MGRSRAFRIGNVGDSLLYTLAVPENLFEGGDLTAVLVLVVAKDLDLALHAWICCAFLVTDERLNALPDSGLEEALVFLATNTSRNRLRLRSTVFIPSGVNSVALCRQVIISSDFARVMAT